MLPYEKLTGLAKYSSRTLALLFLLGGASMVGSAVFVGFVASLGAGAGWLFVPAFVVLAVGLFLILVVPDALDRRAMTWRPFPRPMQLADVRDEVKTWRKQPDYREMRHYITFGGDDTQTIWSVTDGLDGIEPGDMVVGEYCYRPRYVRRLKKVAA